MAVAFHYLTYHSWEAVRDDMRTPTEGILEEILAERDRQIAKGHTIAEDDKQTPRTLIRHAGYIMFPEKKLCPFKRTEEQEEADCERPLRDRLIRAVTVLVAAIELEDRAP